MLLKPVLPILGIATLQAGLMCNPVIAATLSASLSVSVTVEAGCQIFPTESAGEIVKAASGWKDPVSVNCSLPVPYRVSIINSARTDLAPLDATNSDLAGPPPDVHTYSLGLFQPRGGPNDSAEGANLGSTNLPADSIKAGLRPAEESNSETITVIITY